MTVDLTNKRILVTRQEPKASELADHINQCGGEAIVTPLITIECQLSSHGETLIHKLESYEWIVFTSGNGVKCFFNQLKKYGKKDPLKHTHIAAVGPKTNQVLQTFGYQADFMPSVYNAETMAVELSVAYDLKGPVLLVQGQLSRTTINDMLQEKAIPFDRLIVYKTGINKEATDRLQQVLSTEDVDFITFTSPSTIDAFMDLSKKQARDIASTIVCIGTTTEKRALDYGFKRMLVPDEFTIDSMLQKMHDYISEQGR